jgi:hypothetical protein
VDSTSSSSAPKSILDHGGAGETDGTGEDDELPLPPPVSTGCDVGEGADDDAAALVDESFTVAGAVEDGASAERSTERVQEPASDEPTTPSDAIAMSRRRDNGSCMAFLA